MEWKQKFEEAKSRESVTDMVDALQSQATAHAGTAPASVKRSAMKSILRQYASDPERLFSVAHAFCTSGNPTAKEIGAHLLTRCYDVDPELVDNVLHDLADDENWEVREWAADACGDILVQSFERFYSVLRQWTEDESGNVRRAAVLAAMYAGRSRDFAFAEPILNLIEPLLADRAPYVRDNLGPFALGSALIAYYPAQVLKRLNRWARSEDEQVRWHAAMIFSAAAAAKHAIAARPVLDMLRADSSPYVQRAVSKAMRNIRKRCPEWDEVEETHQTEVAMHDVD